MEITLKLENFEGPLSLLYHLIEKDKIDIYDIPIALVTDQYLAVIEEAENRNMDIMSEFLIMAASLLEIKSRMLLPKPKTADGEEEIDPRAELVRKLFEYKQFQSAAEELKELEERAAVHVFKPADPSIEIFKEEDIVEVDEYLKDVSFEDIYKAFQEVLRRKEQKVDRVRGGFKSVERDLYTIEEKIDYIKDLLILSPKIIFFDIFRAGASKVEVIVTFMALLELIKMKEVNISQDKTFGDITITKYIGSEKNEA